MTAAPVGPPFSELGLPVELVQALRRGGLHTAFPIQAATIPDVLAGRDVLGRAATGSGKTLAFGLPMLVRLRRGASAPKRPRAVILAPTRELAVQIERVLDEPALSLGLRTAAVVGGMPIKRQIDRLARGVDLLIATPGRLTDLIAQGAVGMDAVTIVAIDEADHMAQLGFIDQVREILDRLPGDCRHLLFSATLDGAVDALVTDYLTDPVRHEIGAGAAPAPDGSSTGPTGSATLEHTVPAQQGKEGAVSGAEQQDPARPLPDADGTTGAAGTETAPRTVGHHLLRMRPADKRPVLAQIAARAGRTLVFARTQYGADKLARRLRESGTGAVVLHGGLTQNQRNRTLAAFTDGTAPVLVATDVAARGIHVDGITLVVHADPAADAKDYLHRSGRTGRAGAPGTVVTLITDAGEAAQVVLRNAGVAYREARIRPDDALLREVTGARAPSGLPVTDPAAADTPPKSSDTPGRARRNTGIRGRPTRRSKR